MPRAQSPCCPRRYQSPASVARAPSASTCRRRSATGPRRRARGRRASRLCADRHHQRHRALPPPHPLDAHPGYRRSICTRRSPSTSRCSNTGRTRWPMCRRATCRFFVRDMQQHREQPNRWFGSVTPDEVRKVLRRDPQGRRALDPRYRRRRAGREGSCLGEPQAVEAGAAARLLPGRLVTISARPACSRPTS